MSVVNVDVYLAIMKQISQKEKENEALRRLLERSASLYEGGRDSQLFRITLQNQLRTKEEQLKVSDIQKGFWIILIN